MGEKVRTGPICLFHSGVLIISTGDHKGYASRSLITTFRKYPNGFFEQLKLESLALLFVLYFLLFFPII